MAQSLKVDAEGVFITGWHQLKIKKKMSNINEIQIGPITFGAVEPGRAD